MRVKVWTDTVETVTQCKLLNDVAYAAVTVVAMDSDGAVLSTIVELSERGLQRCRNIDPSLGFPLDSAGRVLLVGEERVVKRSEIETLIGSKKIAEYTPRDMAIDSIIRAACIKGIELAGGRVED